MQVFFVRHGALSRRDDWLSSLWEQQSVEAGKYIKSRLENIPFLVSSPRKRCRETAQIIANILDIKQYTIDSRITDDYIWNTPQEKKQEIDMAWWFCYIWKRRLQLTLQDTYRNHTDKSLVLIWHSEQAQQFFWRSITHWEVMYVHYNW